MLEPSDNTGLQRSPQSDLEEITAKARADLLALKGARLFITGGTGYIGRWLLESLCEANRSLGLSASAVVLSRQPARFSEQYPHLADAPGISLVQGDIRDFAFPAGQFTHLVHAATDVVISQNALETVDVTIAGTRRALEFARERGIGDVLLLSSGAVYGRIPAHIDRVPEDFSGRPSLHAPASGYGLGKMVTEWLGNIYSQDHGLACKSARVFAQVGPYLALDVQFAAGNFIRDALLGRTLQINGDGTALRSYMYATDLVAWLWAILVRGTPGQAYNVGSEQAVSIRDLASAIVEAADAGNLGVRVLGRPTTGAASDRYVPDTGKARIELGLSLGVPFETALRRTIAWYRPLIASRQT